MNRAAFRLAAALVLASIPCLSTPAAAADATDAPQTLKTTPATNAAPLLALPGTFQEHLAQSADVRVAPGAPAAGSPPSPTPTPPSTTVNASAQQTADVAGGRPGGAPPTAEVLRVRLAQQADVHLQNASGTNLDAHLSQSANLQGAGTIEDLRARQSIQARVSDNQVQVRERQVLRLRLDGAAANDPQVQAALRQQADIQGTAGAGVDLRTRQVTRVRVTDDEIRIRMVQEIRLRAQQIDREAAQPGGEARVARALARSFGTSEAHIRAERAEHRLGLGELAIARALARATAGSDHPLTLRQVIALRKTEGGWGQVFHRLHNEGLVDAKNLGQVVRQARAVHERVSPARASAVARAEAITRTAGGDEGRAKARAFAKARADGPATAEARAKAVARAEDATAVARARAQARATTPGESAPATVQTVRTRAEVWDAAGHRFTEAAGHRSKPGSLDVRVRAPDPPRARPVTITTAGNRTDFAAVGRGANRGAAHGAQSARARGSSDAKAHVTAAAHGRANGVAVAITSAGNGTHAGGRAAVSSVGHESGGHGHGSHGGHKR